MGVWILILGMIVAVAMAGGVIFVVASPSFRDGEPMFTPEGEERVDRLRDRASAAAVRAESVSRDGAQRAKSAFAKGEDRARCAIASRRGGSAAVDGAAKVATTETASSSTTQKESAVMSRLPGASAFRAWRAAAPVAGVSALSKVTATVGTATPGSPAVGGIRAANLPRLGFLHRITGSLARAGADTQRSRARHSR